MKRSVHGFTLLEMLIALSFLGLLLVLVGSAIHASQRNLAVSHYYGGRLDEIRTAQVFLRGALQQALALPIGATATSPGWVFEGQPQRLSFIAPLPEGLAGGVKIHTLTLEKSLSNTLNLQVAFTQLTDALPKQTWGQTWGQPQALLQGISHLQLSYRGLDPEQHESPWLPNWPWPQRLPAQVRIDLDAAGPVPWIPLVVALRATLGSSQAQP